MLVGGPPCQPWSGEGLMAGLADERGPLIFEMLEYVMVHAPKAVVLEEVKALCHNSKLVPVLKKLIKTLEGLSYDVKWRVLNTKEHGIPHTRP
eukprot:759788-Pyramimonas_sp.AAC.1